MSHRPVRILIIRFSSIGDIVLTAPALAAMRAAVDGECEVHYLTKLAYASIPAGFEGLVDVVHTIEKSTNEVIAELDALGFDYVVDLHNNLRSRRVKRNLKALHFTVEKRNVAKWKLVRGWRTTPIPHIVERYAAVLTAFGVKTPDSWPTLWPTEAPTERRGLCIAIGATHGGKRMPVALLRKVVEAFNGVPIALIGGPSDVEDAQSIASGFEHVRNAVGQFSLEESAHLIQSSLAVLAGDTGMMHLAAALKTPVVTVWGCTRPSLGMAAWKPVVGSVNLEPEGRGEKPCSKLGDRCQFKSPRKDDWCTHHVSDARVIAALKPLLV
jgi:ADP-heptose:LPS heptosyltransferase